jgi:hypothetical protein
MRGIASGKAVCCHIVAFLGLAAMRDAHGGPISVNAVLSDGSGGEQALLIAPKHKANYV